jgi:lipopolysaccharide transport system ATP-binding protein
VIFTGPSEEAVAAHTATWVADSKVFFEVEKIPRKHPGTQAARFVSFRFDRAVPIFSFGEDFSFFARIRALENFEKIRFSMTIFTAEGQPVGATFSKEADGMARGEQTEVQITLPDPKLAPGKYYCGVAVGKGDHRTGHVDFDIVLDTLAFEVRPEEGADGTMAKWERTWGAIAFAELQQKAVKRE